MTGEKADNPFLDRDLLRSHLYATADRLANRTGTLKAAKVEGTSSVDVVCALARRHQWTRGGRLVLDVGCGRGSLSRALGVQLAPARLVALDLSAALLAETRRRAASRADLLCGDFHAVPLRPATFGLVTAAFCLYHSRDPRRVLRELARVLRPRGLVIVVTKSADSYRELDELVARAGLDLAAPRRPSLYETFHSGNAALEVGAVFEVIEQRDDLHRFRFATADHVAAYLATTPKYRLERPLADVGAALRAADSEPIETSSTVTYCVACLR